MPSGFEIREIGKFPQDAERCGETNIVQLQTTAYSSSRHLYGRRISYGPSRMIIETPRLSGGRGVYRDSFYNSDRFLAINSLVVEYTGTWIFETKFFGVNRVSVWAVIWQLM